MTLYQGQGHRNELEYVYAMHKSTVVPSLNATVVRDTHIKLRVKHIVSFETPESQMQQKATAMDNDIIHALIALGRLFSFFLLLIVFFSCAAIRF